MTEKLENEFLVDRRELHLSSSTWNQRAQLSVLEEESFQIPLQQIDVIRRTHTTFDVLQESRINDYWNVDGGRNLS